MDVQVMKASVRPLGRDESRDGIAELRVAAYPEFPEVRDADFYEELYRWYQEHPLADHMHRWVSVTEEGQVVGHVAALPQFYRVAGHRVVAHTPGDYMVHPKYGFQALSLMRTFFRTAENCVACDMVPAVISVETRLGAEVAGEMQYAAKLLNVSRLPVPAVPEPVRKLLRLPEKYSSARGFGGGPEAETERDSTVRGVEEPVEPPALRPRAPIPAPLKAFLNWTLETVDGALSTGYGGALNVEEVEEFDETFDDLFEKVATIVPCVPEKDSAFLRWRYGPNSPQDPLIVLGVRGPRGLLGYAVLKVTAKGEDGYIMDLTALPGHRDTARALLRESVHRLRREGVHIIRYRFLESPTSLRSEDLRRLGFFYRKGRRNNLLVKFADGGLHKAARDLDNWAYNIGDGEATFWLR